MTFAHKTRILNGFEAETSVRFSKLCWFFHVYRNKSLPSIDDFWSILKIIHWAFVFTLGLSLVEVAGVEQKLYGILGKH